jgi:anti-anti-sigma factor
VTCGFFGGDNPVEAACSWEPRDQDTAADCRPGLAIITEGHNGRTVLRLQGELDVGNREHLRRAISNALERRPQILVIDLTAVGFADCGGLSVLVWAHQQLAQEGRELIITEGQPMVSRLMRLAGLTTYLNLGGRLDGGGT